MSLTTIVSYDGTPNDDDALTLASVLGEAGADLILAYVRHDAAAADDARLRREAAARARGRGARRGATSRRASWSTARPARASRSSRAAEGAELIVFGSDYRTPAGRVAPQKSTQKLLRGRARGDRDRARRLPGARRSARSGCSPGSTTHAAIDTAHALANHFGATVTDTNYGVDLLIVGSRPEAHEGQTMLSAQAENAIVGTTAPVLVVGRGVAVDFQLRAVHRLAPARPPGRRGPSLWKVARPAGRATRAFNQGRAHTRDLRPAPRPGRRHQRAHAAAAAGRAARRARSARPAGAARRHRRAAGVASARSRFRSPSR